MLILEEVFSLKAILIDRQGIMNDSDTGLFHMVLGGHHSSPTRFCFYLMTNRYATPMIIKIIAIISNEFRSSCSK